MADYHTLLAQGRPRRLDLGLRLRHLGQQLVRWLERLPHSALALLARFSLATLFWQSGQTKISGLQLDPLQGIWQWGWPRLNDSARYLFAEEYRLPWLDPELAALLAASCEHLLALLLLLGLATRLAAAGLLGMVLVIQLLVYPDAYPTHGIWACGLLLLLAHGAGVISLDRWLSRWLGAGRD